MSLLIANSTNKMSFDYQGYPSKLQKLLALLSIGVSKSSMIKFVDISEPTLDRYLRSIREDWGCTIEYDRTTKLYTLTDSGKFKSPKAG